MPISLYVSFIPDERSANILWCFGAMADRHEAHIVTSRALRLVPHQRIEEALVIAWRDPTNGGAAHASAHKADLIRHRTRA